MWTEIPHNTAPFDRFLICTSRSDRVVMLRHRQAKGFADSQCSLFFLLHPLWICENVCVFVPHATSHTAKNMENVVTHKHSAAWSLYGKYILYANECQNNRRTEKCNIKWLNYCFDWHQKRQNHKNQKQNLYGRNRCTRPMEVWDARSTLFRCVCCVVCTRCNMSESECTYEHHIPRVSCCYTAILVRSTRSRQWAGISNICGNFDNFDYAIWTYVVSGESDGMHVFGLTLFGPCRRMLCTLYTTKVYHKRTEKGVQDAETHGLLFEYDMVKPVVLQRNATSAMSWFNLLNNCDFVCRGERIKRRCLVLGLMLFGNYNELSPILCVSGAESSPESGSVQRTRGERTRNLLWHTMRRRMIYRHCVYVAHSITLEGGRGEPTRL